MGKNDPATKEVATKTGTTAVGVVHDYGAMAGAGFESQTSDDIAIPFLGLLQSNSPELIDDDPKFIEGAKAGDLFNTVTRELFPATDGAFVVPCYTEKVYIEWVPRDDGGGFVGVHDPHSDVVAKAKEQATDRNRLKKNGNDLIETSQMYCLLLDGPDATASAMPIVVSFTSTKLKVYRALNLKLRTVKGRPPLFAFRLKVSSRSEKSKRNEPYKNFVIEPVGGSAQASMIDPAGDQAGLLTEATALIDAVKSGIAKAAHDTGTQEGSGGEAEVF